MSQFFSTRWHVFLQRYPAPTFTTYERGSILVLVMIPVEPLSPTHTFLLISMALYVACSMSAVVVLYLLPGSPGNFLALLSKLLTVGQLR